MNRDDLRDVLALIAPLKRKLAIVASRCVASIVRDSSAMQSAQVENLSGEAFDPVEHMQPGGLSHVPLSGAEGVRVTMSGVYDDSVVLALSNRSNRPTGLSAGDTCVYGASATQAKVIVRADGDVEVQASTGRQVQLSTSGAPTQSFVRGEDLVVYLNAVIAATSAAIGGVPAAGTGLKATFDAAILAAAPLRAAALSADIKGE